ncbi:MAG: hypothetical protein U0271_43450 [Polyangiaceae bacterium]
MSEPLELEMLTALTVYSVGARAPFALELTHQLERRALGLGRADLRDRARGLRGCVLLEMDQLNDAVRELSWSIEHLEASGFHHFERWHRLHRGFAHYALGQSHHAIADFEDFIAMSDGLGGSALLGVLGGQLAGSLLAKARLPTLAQPPACFAPYVDIIARGERPPLEASSLRALASAPEPPGYYALEVRCLSRALAVSHGESPQPSRRIMVGPNALWFCVGPSERQSLGRSKTLRRILSSLLDGQGRGTVLTTEQLFQLGWPDERASSLSMANRVHVTLCRLRAMGLRDFILYRDNGWLFDPAAEVIWSSQGL